MNKTEADFSNISIDALIKDFDKSPGIMSLINLPKIANAYLARPLNDELIRIIYLIGLLGWSAHSIYDKIRDQDSDIESETGSKNFKTISRANQYINQMHLLRTQLFLRQDQELKIAFILQRMEHANFMEECNIEDRGYIYRSTWKSMGAALPLILLLMKSNAHKSHIRRCLSFFYHLIAARQLSDDAVDWQEDIMSGKHSLVSYLIVNASIEERTNGTSRSSQYIFDYLVTPIIAKRIIHHTSMAISFARRLTCFTSTRFLESLPQHYLDLAAHILRRCELRDRFDEIFWRRG